MESLDNILPVLPEIPVVDGLLNASKEDVVTELPKLPSSEFHNNSKYDGDFIDETPPPNGEYQKFDFPNPFLVVAFYDHDIADGIVTLHPWQLEVNQILGTIKPTAKKPFKYPLLASNGSGKDKFVIAPFCIWFVLTKIRSRVIVTTASGNQLTSQTEPYIKDLCDKVNKFHGQEIFRIRQRYIKCLLTGSEIRMFATDEAGKAEGYHPIDATSEMAIIVNEGKSVTEDIHRALRRCTGYNYWLEISSAGEPKGFLHSACTKAGLGFQPPKRITSFDCPHIPQEDIEADKIEDGEHSAFFRSKHLSLFTSIGGQYVIPIELVNYCIQFPPKFGYTKSKWVERIGLDLAAGGDENAVVITKGNKVILEKGFRELDTTVAADKIEQILILAKISKNHPHIYADDGGVGRSIIDMLVRKGWKINRIMNQWAALGNKKQFGNRGAENWYRVARIIEEKFFDLTGLSEKCREQLWSRQYKQTTTSGRIYLQSKPEAKAEGLPSPDRADAFILSLTGLTVDDFIQDAPNHIEPTKEDKRAKERFTTPEEVERHYEDNVTYEKNQKPTKARFKTLSSLINN